jgi:translation elongation factor EF-Tu-like GTPase
MEMEARDGLNSAGYAGDTLPVIRVAALKLVTDGIRSQLWSDLKKVLSPVLVDLGEGNDKQVTQPESRAETVLESRSSPEPKASAWTSFKKYFSK